MADVVTGPVYMLVPRDEAKMTTRQQGLRQVVFEMHSWRMGVSKSSSWQIFQNNSLRSGGGGGQGHSDRSRAKVMGISGLSPYWWTWRRFLALIPSLNQ